MQETGNKISPELNIVDESFHLESLRYYHLFIELGSDELSYCVFDHKRNKYLLLRFYDFANFENKLSIEENIEQVIETDELLRQQDFNKISVSVVNNTATLLPVPLYDESKAKDVLEFNHSINSEDLIYTDHLNSLDAKNIFSVSNSISSIIKKRFSSATVHHFSSSLIESITFQYKNMQAPILTVHFRNKNLEIIVTQNKKLLFYNSFPFVTSEDYIYYLLFVYEKLELNPETVNLVLKGNIDRNSELYKVTNKYIRNVSFGTRPDTFNFSYRFDNLAHHKFAALLNQHLCE
ncbi:MAG: DUF3822 family protein [Bacteroidia bacterium]|nr:DUF3822 family protein [Bacteroidia bacterium]